MRKKKRAIVWIITIVILPVVLNSCSAKHSDKLPETRSLTAAYNASFSERSGHNEDSAVFYSALDELAEFERSGVFIPGLGLAESKLREDAGDFSGSVLAVYKELSWAYALGIAELDRDSIRQGLENLLEADLFSPEAHRDISLAVRAILAFFEGRYEEAEPQLEALYSNDDEADSFSRYLLLVCVLETGKAGRKELSAFHSLRSRYAGFPEYWFRLAHYTEQDAASFAERCINLAPNGPFAAESRIILAQSMGLSAEEASAVKTRFEIENTITEAVNNNSPGLLSDLLPLAALPDNPSTLYASGAMRALAANELFRIWFIQEAQKARGRLAERLHYISRG